ncbi:unnamed protein product [Thelazia callipaeda]|uniref:Col_cuticle_N domain-containing protein n=1 Tax=Thelazia callipaeda TaxID=103827 RepID=A0A0N5D8F9_THECL|nr:unnamed protein product [Thelazia callipaeda]
MAEQRNDDAIYLKERNHRYIRRAITIFAVVLTLFAIILVTLSLSLGSKIDELENFLILSFNEKYSRTQK